jgi:hypothetical protein
LSIDITVYKNKWERIVPLRFIRAVTGQPQRYATDLDDRGGKWTQSSVTTGEFNQVKIIRENIENSAKLYVTSSKTGVVSLHNPILRSFQSNSIQLPNSKEMVVIFWGVSSGNAKLEVRFNDPSGVIIAELNIYVVDLLKPGVRAHLVTIRDATGASGTTARNAGSVNNLFQSVNDIWRPCGIEFVLHSTRNTNLPLAVRGDLSVNSLTKNYAEFSTLMRTNRLAHAINVYFVRNIADAGGAGIRGLGLSLVASPTHYGVCVVDASDANDLAHELGHVLNLVPSSSNNVAHADDSPDDSHKRDDMWSKRRLMYSYNPYLPAKIWHTDVGCGANQRGALITIKNLPNDGTDRECGEARLRGSPRLP